MQQSFTYTFDHMGNHTAKSEGGCVTATEGTGTRAVAYTPTALNQYSAITTPQSFDVTGRRSDGTKTVSVTGGGSAVYQNNSSTGLQFDSVVTGSGLGAIGSYKAVTVTESTPTVTIDAGDISHQAVPVPSLEVAFPA